MSYCRWSSDNFQCDLYCYESGDGDGSVWVTHVARSRRDWNPPYDLYSDYIIAHSHWRLLYKFYHIMMAKAPCIQIGLPYDGETFNDHTLESFLNRVLVLKDAGYRMPDSLMKEIRSEINGDCECHTE